MLENQTHFGDMEDEGFDVGEAQGSYGFMNAEEEGEGFGDFEGFGGDQYGADQYGTDQYGADGFGDQYSDGYDHEGFENEGFDQYSLGEGFDGEGFDGEGEEFFGKVWKLAKQAAKVAAPLAKKFAPAIGTVIGGALGGPAGAALGGKLGGFVKSMESEDEGETEDEMNAVSRIPVNDDQLSEAMAVAATRSRPIDAGSLGSALTVTIASRAPLPVKAVMPVLAKAGGDVARKLAASRDPRARVLIRTLPTIQKRTIATLTKKAQSGKPITPRTAVRVMARHASRTLGNEQVIAKALANNAVKKRGIDRKAVSRAERFY